MIKDNCTHEVEDLENDNEGNIYCTLCTMQWNTTMESPELISVLFNSFKKSTEFQDQRIQNLTTYIKENNNVESCFYCGDFYDKKSLKSFSSQFTCNKHVPHLLGTLDETEIEEYSDEINDWMLSLYNNISDLKSLWKFLHPVLHYPDIISELNLDINNIVIKGDKLSFLGLKNRQYSVKVIVQKFSNKYTLDLPRTNIGIAWVVGVIVEILNNLDITIDDLYDCVIPQDVEARALLAVDLGVQSMPDGTEFSSQMADELLIAISERLYENVIMDLKEKSVSKQN